MWFKHCLLIYYVALTTQAVEVSLSGALRAGSEVAKVLSHYFNDDVLTLSGRRAMSSSIDDLVKNIKELELCKDLKFCDSQMEKFLFDYVLALINAVRQVFDDVLDDEFCKVKYVQKTLRLAKKVVQNSAMDSDDIYRWTNVLKKISATFLEKAQQLSEETSNALDTNKQEAMILIRQQLVFAIVNVERQYQLDLCRARRMCPFKYDASTHLQHFLNLIKTMNETKVKIFVKGFKRTFLGAPLLKELDYETLFKFNQILNDMMQNNVHAKDIILSISGEVQNRLVQIEPEGKDAFLLQSILSDLDHLYVTSIDEPIETFLDEFKRWSRDSDQQMLSMSMEAFYSGLATHFANQPAELVYKMKTECLVFLELAVR